MCALSERIATATEHCAPGSATFACSDGGSVEVLIIGRLLITALATTTQGPLQLPAAGNTATPLAPCAPPRSTLAWNSGGSRVASSMDRLLLPRLATYRRVPSPLRAMAAGVCAPGSVTVALRRGG